MLGFTKLYLMEINITTSNIEARELEIPSSYYKIIIYRNVVLFILSEEIIDLDPLLL